MTKRFLYNRVGILVCDVVAVAFFIAGMRGFAHWFGGFILALWLALALFNYTEHSSLWLLMHKRHLFLRFYAALALSFFVIDQCGQMLHLWFSPLYHGWGALVVYLFLVPLGGLALGEVLHSFPRAARLSLLIAAGTLIIAAFIGIMPSAHLREWVYLGEPFSAFFNFIFFGLPVFAWLGALLFAAVPLALSRALALHPQGK